MWTCFDFHGSNSIIQLLLNILQGLIMLTLSVTVHVFKPPPCEGTGAGYAHCLPATAGQVGFFYFALYLMSLGGGSMKPCIAAFGADQFDEEDTRECAMKKSFFNWWVFGISIGGLISATVLVYVQDYVSWGWGFGTPTVLMGVYLILYVVGMKYYRHKPPTGSPFTQIAQVSVRWGDFWA
jgi:peptide/histidine transporter 3/4